MNRLNQSDMKIQNLGKKFYVSGSVKKVHNPHPEKTEDKTELRDSQESTISEQINYIDVPIQLYGDFVGILQERDEVTISGILKYKKKRGSYIYYLEVISIDSLSRIDS